jgi:hypothetical protein
MTLRRLVAVPAVALALTACSSSADRDPGPEPQRGSSPTLVERSPLTGKPMKDGPPDNPVLIVKVENTGGGAPQIGLDEADLVVEELVEGGLTRLAAFYYSTLPETVGHVRSLRATDIGIAAPVGGQIVASGGATGTYTRVKHAGITVFSEDEKAPGFSSDPLKSRPYNRLVDLTTVAEAAKDTEIHAPYLAWTPEGVESVAVAGTKRATSASVRFSPFSSTRWALQDDRWQRVNGHAVPGQDFEADTLVVLYCEVRDAGYLDPAGNPVPETALEGTGRATVLRGDEVIEATWTKESARSTITFETEDGTPLTIDPGHVFMELVPEEEGAVTLG